MKTAKVEIKVAEIYCRYCEEGIPHPVTGSYLWDTVLMSELSEVKCAECGKSQKVPQRFRTKRK